MKIYIKSDKIKSFDFFGQTIRQIEGWLSENREIDEKSAQTKFHDFFLLSNFFCKKNR